MPCGPPQGSSQGQHPGTVGGLREVEGGGTAILRLWERQRPELGGALGTGFPPRPGPSVHPPVCAAWLGEQQKPRARSLCSHQSHRPSCGCHKPRAQTARPAPAGPAPGSSPRSHPCRDAGQAWDQPHPAWGQPVPRAQGPGASPEGVVTLHHEAAEGSVVAPAEGSRCLGRAPDLPHDVPCPPEALLAHQVSARWRGTGSADVGDRAQWLQVVGEPPEGDLALARPWVESWAGH